MACWTDAVQVGRIVGATCKEGLDMINFEGVVQILITVVAFVSLLVQKIFLHVKRYFLSFHLLFKDEETV